MQIVRRNEGEPVATKLFLIKGSHNGLPIGMHRGSTKTHPLGTMNGDRNEELTPKIEDIWAQERAD